MSKHQQIQQQKPLSGRFVFACFFVFFALVVVVNTIFITNALKSHSGVVTKNPYEAGLRYNEVLERADNQPKLQETLSLNASVLSWNIRSETGQPISNAQVTVKAIRPVKEGMDFETTLPHNKSGLYSNTINFPAKGQWIIKLDAQWDKNRYQKTQTIIVP